MLAGWFVPGLVGTVMIVAGSAKLFGFAPAQVVETLQSVGLSQQIVGLLEVSTVLIYLVPKIGDSSWVSASQPGSRVTSRPSFCAIWPDAGGA